MSIVFFLSSDSIVATDTLATLKKESKERKERGISAQPNGKEIVSLEKVASMFWCHKCCPPDFFLFGPPEKNFPLGQRELVNFFWPKMHFASMYV